MCRWIVFIRIDLILLDLILLGFDSSRKFIISWFCLTFASFFYIFHKFFPFFPKNLHRKIDFSSAGAPICLFLWCEGPVQIELFLLALFLRFEPSESWKFDEGSSVKLNKFQRKFDVKYSLGSIAVYPGNQLLSGQSNFYLSNQIL